MKTGYVVLSRKYRPRKLSDLVGQEILSESLQNCINNNKIPHAFLFHGIRGIGKTTTARILARCLNCVGQGDIPCGDCASCKAMDADNHLDVIEIDAASRTGVDDIRDIIDSSQYSPLIGKYKVFIIDEVHMLSKSAFNALLKTLEEPPSHVKFIFATTESKKVPETVLSRCMTFNLKPISTEIITEHVVKIADCENVKIDEEAANAIAIESEGSLRDSLSLLEQAIMLANGQTITDCVIKKMIGGAKDSEITELLKLMLSSNTLEALTKSEELLRKGADAYIIYKSLQTALFKTIVNKVKNKNSCTYTLSNLLYIWQIFLKQFENIKNALYTEHVLKATIIIISFTASFEDIENLMFEKDNENTNSLVNVSERKTDIQIDTNKEENENNKSIVEDILKRFPDSTVAEVL
jgi:DNA polymerase-3 subunit gamma/tau